MIRLFAPYEPSDKIRVDALNAFAEGLNCEYKIEDLFKGYKSCDIAVTFGVYKRSAKSGQMNGEIFDKHKGPIVVIELGFVHRDRYFMVGFNGLNGRADFKNENSPPDRWNKLDVQLQERQTGKNIIVCGQKRNDASVQHSKHEKWLQNTVKYILTHSKSPVIFRPHPLENPKKAVRVKFKHLQYSKRPFEEDLKNCKAVVTYNSNSGVEAIIAGVPAFAFDEGSMIWPICNKKLKNIDNPAFPDRIQWANNLAYTQWTMEEMRQGLPQAHLCLE